MYYPTASILIDFFLEYHGKSLVDARFSWISRAIQQYTSTEHGRIFTDAELLECLRLKEEEYNSTAAARQCQRKHSTQILLNYEDTELGNGTLIFSLVLPSPHFS